MHHKRTQGTLTCVISTGWGGGLHATSSSYQSRGPCSIPPYTAADTPRIFVTSARLERGVYWAPTRPSAAPAPRASGRTT